MSRPAAGFRAAGARLLPERPFHQSWLLSLFLAEAAPYYRDDLYWLAERVALNRERAGVHYPSDTAAGKFIAEQCLATIKAKCADIPTLFGEAYLEWT